MPLVVIGSLGIDTIQTPHGKVEEVLGGSAIHFALAASLLTKVRIVCTAGTEDCTDKTLAPLLVRTTVCTKGICYKPGKTFRWGGRYSEDMNSRETTFVELNVFGQYAPELPAEYTDSRFVFLANGSPEHQLMILERFAKPHFTALDTMDHWIQSHRPALEKVLRRVDCVVVNDSEAKLLTGLDGIKAARAVLKLGPKYVIVKGGAHGACLVSAEETFCIPAYPTAQVLDPTGAGDTFAGGFMGWLAKAGTVDSKALRRAMAYGTVIASYNVEDFGVNRVSKLTMADVRKRMKEFKQMLAF